MAVKNKKSGLGKDLLIAFVIAAGILAIIVIATTIMQNQMKSYFIFDQTTIIVSDIIGFIIVFLISLGFLRSARKKEYKETSWNK